ncbi:MAG: aminoacetone oxidase family FAD-binding enzyme, partial [Mogibacterium sp.]|nr:aminoacetone oxidase family FAD-binding enzyme [Mogibacterium sp.]
MITEAFDIAIIGGGASGLMLAASLDLEGARGIILEGSSHVGSKLLMSGGGRCNITHGGSIKDFLSAYGDKGPSFRKALYRHSNDELKNWLEEHDVLLTEEEGRIFPASMRAKDVLDVFTKEATRNGWHIRTDTKVAGLRKKENRDESKGESRGDRTGNSNCDTWDIELKDDEIIKAKNVVIATGGITYPETGSDGSMFEILKGLGIGVTELRPALAPVYVEDYPYGELSGVSLNDVTVSVMGSASATGSHKGKGKPAHMTGDILFTHDGFSGPAILNISGYAEPGKKIRLSYNKELSELPKRMQRVLQDRARGESGDIKTTVLASLLDHDDFIVKAIDDRGMVT